MQLTAEQQLALAHAAKAAGITARRAQPAIRSFAPPADSSIYRRSARIDVVCNVTFAVVGLLVIAITFWPVATPPVQAAANPAPAPTIAAAPAAPAASKPPLIRVTNPFDANEVFEFPAENPQQARQAMTELLLQRARDRVAQGIVRLADIRRTSREPIDEQPQILVTKLSGAAD